ncbi:hypothetical protein ABIE50_001863 [Chitinophaga sp. OAE865]
MEQMLKKQGKTLVGTDFILKKQGFTPSKKRVYPLDFSETPF